MKKKNKCTTKITKRGMENLVKALKENKAKDRSPRIVLLVDRDLIKTLETL